MPFESEKQKELDRAARMHNRAVEQHREGKPHPHEWVPRIERTKSGRETYYHKCTICGEEEVSKDGTIWTNLGDPTPAGNLGGFKAYDKATEMVYMADGSTIDVTALLASNKDADRTAVWAQLEKLPTVTEAFTKTSTMAKTMGEATKSMSALGGAFSGFGFDPATKPAKPATTISTRVAMRVILDDIRNSPDPFKAGGEWITKLTREIGDVIREDPEDA